MSTTIDQRVVEMRFDNQHFEKNVSTTMSTLERFKQKLNFTGASKGLEDVNAAAKKVDMGVLANAVNTVGNSFSALQVMAVTTLANLTNSAVNAGKRIVNALTFEPVMSGFQEYETQINSVQTILANTSHAGTDLQDVNNALDTLNTYADKTIYNFTEMTRNIGTFTAAGVDLDTSVNAIKGIANLAAVSGSTSQQASTAMYQLSQALAAGTVKLQDWNSVVNAGMGGKVFQDALVRTAAVMSGSAKDVDAWRKANIDAHGSFRDSLTEGAWLTTEVLTNTLSQFTGDMTDAQLRAQGYTEQQITDIQKMAVTANDAATKVKTFTQLWDTLKEAAQSGWTQTWEIIVGDFEEAKTLLTSISDVLNDMIGKSAEARNSLLSKAFSKTDVTSYLSDLTGMTGDSINQLKALGETTGYTSDEFKELASTLAEGDENMQATITNLLKMSASEQDVASYISEITGMTERSVNSLHRLGKKAGYTSDEFKDMAMTLAEGDEAMAMSITHILMMSDEIDKLSGREALIESFKNVFEALLGVVKPVKEAFSNIFPAITADQVYNTVLAFKEFTEGLKISDKTAKSIKRTFEGLFSILDLGRKVILSVTQPLLNLLRSDGLASVGTLLLDVAAAIGDFFVSMNEGFDASGINGLLSSIVAGVSNFLGIATDKIRGFGDIFKFVGGIITDVASSMWDAIQSVFGWIAENVSLSDVFVGLTGSGVFVLAKKLADLVGNVKDMFEDLFGKKGGFLSIVKESFTDVMDSVHGALESFTVGINAAALVSIALAIGILSASLKSISTLSAVDITKSLFAIGTLLTMLSVGFRSITKSLKTFNHKGIIKAGLALVLMASSIKILADAMSDIAKLSLAEIGKGLLGIGASLIALCAALKVINKVKIPLRTSVAILALAYSCKILADALSSFSQMNWDEIGRGLTAMGGALAELVVSISILGKFGGFKSLLSSIGIVIIVQSLEKMANGLATFANMSWDEIKRGLAAMGGALSELTATLSIIGKVAGFSSIFAAGAIWIVTQGLDELASALCDFSVLTWEEIEHGLTAMGGALAELVVTLGTLGKVAGFSSIFAAGAILIVVQGLGDIYTALSSFATMSWDEIGKGLSAMGGALAEVGIVTGAVGKLAGFAGIFGAGAIWITIQGLSELADAFKKFGQMNWDEIGRGLVAMGGALLEVGAITGAMGYLTGLAGVLGGAAIWVAVQGLDDLAEALKKFAGMSWDEISRGLSAMGEALMGLAIGGLANTFSIIGSFSIEKVAEPLGVLADSVKKWIDVKVPESLGMELTKLANGISAFTFGGMGALTLSAAAEPLGILAESVKKWVNVSVPENMETNLTSLANGIKAFSWAFMGGWSIGAAAEPLGTLATSVSKWRSVSVPEDIETKLTSLANGVKAFSWAFMGGWSISTIVEPLGLLPDSLKKWNGVRLPENLETNLTSLANGVKSFTWAFMSGWSIGTIVEPLGALADTVKKWRNVSIPETLGEELDSLAEGVKSFTWAFMSGWSIDTIAGPLGALADAVKKFSGVTFPEDIGTKLTSVADGVKAFGWIPDLTGVVGSVSSIVSSIQKLGSLNYDYVSSGLQNFSNTLKNLGAANVDAFVNSLATAGSRVSEAVNNLMVIFANTVTANQPFILLAFTTILRTLIENITLYQTQFKVAGIDILIKFQEGMTQRSTILFEYIKDTLLRTMLKLIEDRKDDFKKAGEALVSSLLEGVKSKTGELSQEFENALNEAKNAVENMRGEFYDAGANVAAGMAEGIRAGIGEVQSAASELAAAASAAAKIQLDINSPSGVFRDEVGAMVAKGMAEGIDKNAYQATRAVEEMADAIVTASTDSIDKDTFEDKIGSKISKGIANGIINNSDKAVSAAKQTSKKIANASAEWIEAKKKNNELSLIDELAAWKRVQEINKEGSEERNRAVEEVKRVRSEMSAVNEEYYNNVLNVQRENTEKRKQIDDDYYRTVQETNERMSSDIQSLELEYDNALESRSESLYKSYGLFDEVTNKFVNSNDLIGNLQSQITTFENWTKNLEELSSKGVSSELIEELRDMGVSSAAQIEAINRMSEKQLDQYVSLWESKHRLAKTQAFYELDDMREEIGRKVNDVLDATKIELESHKQSWADNIQAINEESSVKLDELKNTWLEKVVGLTLNTESEFTKMVTEIANIIGYRSKWSESGANIIEGVIGGVADESSKLTSKIQEVMTSALTVAKQTLGINSPSKEFAEIGMYSDIGLANGLTKFAYKVSASAKSVGKTAIDSLKSTITKLSTVVEDGIDSQPTIRPVLDLSNVESGTSRLNALFSRTQAMSINTSMNRKNSEESQNGDKDVSSGGNTYTFTQNNYSPKALSRLEIYRQTKNQFSAMKGLVKS